MEIFKEIKNMLEEKNFDKYNEIFYGTGKYPIWSGYTIGYHLIQNYLKEHPNLNWKELLVKDPKEILSFLTNEFDL